MIKIASNITNLLNKQAALSDYLKNDYVRYGAGGALGGAALGAIINKLMGGSALKGGLIGAGLGGAAGLGAAGIKGYRKNQERLANQARAASFVGNRTPEEEQAAQDYTAKIMNLDNPARNWLTPRQQRQENTLALGGLDAETVKQKTEKGFNFIEDAQEFMRPANYEAGIDYLNALINYKNINTAANAEKDPLGALFGNYKPQELAPK